MDEELYTTPELEEWGTVVEATQTGGLPGTAPHGDDDDDDDDDDDEQ
jgi:hypothetical protein